jgi:formylglycine-generating enzyme required for sulfatase activity
MSMGAFLFDFDKYTPSPTPMQYKDFLAASGYAPHDRTNFLHHWQSNGTSVPASLVHSPVAWVSFDDACAYCRHAGKRLPAP